MQRLAPIRRTRKAMNWPCSGPICISASARGAVTARSRARTGDSRKDAPSMYSCAPAGIPQVRVDMVSLLGFFCKELTPSAAAPGNLRIMNGILSIRNLTKTYAGGHQALKSVSLEIRRGEIFALLGPNGA